MKYADELLGVFQAGGTSSAKAVAAAEDSLRAHLGGGIEQFCSEAGRLRPVRSGVKSLGMYRLMVNQPPVAGLTQTAKTSGATR